jgi:endonuclease/exonuclease/phosphatase (EEP) superfamily protein YafD
VILTGGALFTWFALSWQTNPPIVAPPTHRVAEWNVGRPGPWRFERCAAWLRPQGCDVIAVAEGDNHDKLLPWETKFPAYQAVHLPGEMVCLVRGEVLSQTNGLLDNGSYYTLLRVRVRGQELTILQADVNAAPRHSRAVALRRLAEVAHAHASERLLVLGDFNTPRDSIHFDPFRAELVSVIDHAGRGLSETWPIPLPMLTLDHLWCSRALRPLSCWIGWPWLSDHRPMVAEFGEP